MNTKEKGRRNERKARDILQDMGYDVAMAPRSSFGKGNHDLFGCWDIIAVNNNEVRFIQVKSNRIPYGKQRIKYELFRCPLTCSKEIWVFYDRVKEPEIIYL